MQTLPEADREASNAIKHEELRQRQNIELIASENYVSKAVLEAQGSILTNKYAEGYPGNRYYGGCEAMDEIETLAINRAKQLFKAEHANVQPHSGAQANMATYMALINPGDTVMGMSLSHGGHLTHGSPVNFSGRLYHFVSYTVEQKSERLDYDEIEQIALVNKPRLIVAGASAYSRIIDFKRFQEIANKVNACLFVDMAHIAGLVAAGLHLNPVPYADVVSSTTHKTLRGPRGGFILCKEKHAKHINSAVFPGVQGGPLMHIIAAKAVAFGEALKPDFLKYQQSVINNAKVLAQGLQERGLRIVSGGTDTHMVLVDLTSTGITGKVAEKLLDSVSITVNKNAIPFDTQPPNIASGIRLGTPAITTRGFGTEELKLIAELIVKVISNPQNEEIHNSVRKLVRDMTGRFPLPE